MVFGHQLAQFIEPMHHLVFLLACGGTVRNAQSFGHLKDVVAT